MEGLLRMEQGDQILPFVRCFYGSPSTYLWEDETGNVQDIPQGDPLMPFLFELGLQGALSAMKTRLRDGEKVFVVLDVYVICALEWVSDVHKVLEEEIFAHQDAPWEDAGVEPRECDSSGRGYIDKGGPVDQTRCCRLERW